MGNRGSDTSAGETLPEEFQQKHCQIRSATKQFGNTMRKGSRGHQSKLSASERRRKDGKLLQSCCRIGMRNRLESISEKSVREVPSEEPHQENPSEKIQEKAYSPNSETCQRRTARRDQQARELPKSCEKSHLKQEYQRYAGSIHHGRGTRSLRQRHARRGARELLRRFIGDEPSGERSRMIVGMPKLEGLL